jgi:pSer/pThr/pTyr-binding forkhead associated (FHA) protein
MPPPIPRPRLELLRGTQVLAQHEIPADRPLVIGRTEQCVVQLPHSSVSRQHAKVWADADGVFVEDLGSANGTFVEGQRISAITRLAHGQRIQVGQRTVDEPLLLRFEDPATRLLQEMGLVAPPPESSSPKASSAGPAPAGAAPAASTQTGPSAPPPTAVKPGPTPTQATAPPPGTLGGAQATRETTVPPEELAAASAEPVMAVAVAARPWWRSPVVWVGGLLGLAVLAGGVVFLLRQFRPAATVWRSVELRPAQVAPGDNLLLVTPDVRPDHPVVATIAGEPVPNAQPQPGQLVLVVPTLAAHGAGTHDLPLVVRERDLVVFQGTLRYVVQPRIEALVPGSVTGGELVQIRGKGFPDDPDAVQVTVGGQRAVVRGSSQEQVTIEAPELSRRDPVDAPVSLRTGNMEVSAPTPLRVAPRPPRPLELTVTAALRPDLGAWEVRSALGPVFYLAGDEGDRATLEARLTALNAALAAVVQEARADPRTAIRVRAEGERILLVAAGRELIRFSDGELARAIPSPSTEPPDPEAVASWIAGVWNTFLPVVARGEAPAAGPSHVAALARLVELNRAGGGSGRPELADLEGLTAAEREQLAGAFLRLPPRLGTLAGSWRVTMPNPANPTANLAIDLELTQRGRSLQGKATVRLVATGMEMALPTVPVDGSVQAGSPARIRLRFTAARPVGTVELVGEATDDALAGTAQGSRGEVSWQGTRTGG